MFMPKQNQMHTSSSEGESPENTFQQQWGEESHAKLGVWHKSPSSLLSSICDSLHHGSVQNRSKVVS